MTRGAEVLYKASEAMNKGS